PGGGGYGSPFDRPVAEVMADVACGFVSLEGALKDYGVVIRKGKVAEADTEKERTRRRVGQKNGVFDYGLNRDRFESVWPRKTYDILIDFLMSLPVEWRFYMKHR